MTYSWQRLLVILGLVIIPFYEIFLHTLPLVRSVSPDSRVNKEIIALVFSLSIGLLAVFQGTLKPFNNKYFLLIPVYLLFNLIMSPHADLFINNNEVGDFYFWKPFAIVLCFSLMIIAVASMEIKFEEILKVMVICATIMSIYVILQKFGFDQFWMPKGNIGGSNGNVFTAVRAEALGGNLGQPTIVSCWIIMMVPLGMYLKKYWMVALMVVACVLTQGAVVISSLLIIWLISVFYLYKELRIVIITFLLLSVIIIAFNKNIQSRIINRMDGRWAVWTDIASDLHNGQIKDGMNMSITGAGFGRFGFTFPDRHHSVFHEAHNDPYQFMYDCGFIGELLLLGGVFLMIHTAWMNLSPICLSILLSFIAVFLCSLGTFPFQLGAHQFYASVLVGLLHNRKLLGGLK